MSDYWVFCEAKNPELKNNISWPHSSMDRTKVSEALNLGSIPSGATKNKMNNIKCKMIYKNNSFLKYSQ
jgi:hypothetical protein